MQKQEGPALSRAEGFTIIELIVVIAIIAILSAIVMANVLNYVKKTKITAIKAEMNVFFTYAIDYYNSNGNYNGLCNGETYNKIADKILENSGHILTCADTTGGTYGNPTSNGGWIACADYYPNVANLSLSAPVAFCVDSSGKKVEAIYQTFGSCGQYISGGNFTCP